MITKKIGSDYKIIDGAESYKNIKNKERGIILFHGYSGSPSEMLILAKKFEDRGISVYCPRLTGHGTNFQDFEDTKMQDWFRCATDAYLEFSKRVKNVYLVGLSMGGILSSYLAYLFNIEKIALLATPYDYPDKKFKYLWLIKPFFNRIKQPNSAPALNNLNNKNYLIYYKDYYSIKSLIELKKTINFFRKILKKVKADSIIFHSEKDKIVSYRSPQMIYNKIGSKRKQLIYLKKSNHVLSLDYEVDIIFDNICSFFNI
ncbi:MAG: alpha/beta fold hydrolase [Spirochaetes bacterium]|nr:alpha/beta fold hydrolase [Spirochaetota bacterium]